VKTALCLVVLAAVALAAPAAAEKSQKFHSLWFVEEAMPTPAEFDVREGDKFARTRLLPPGLAVTSEDIKIGLEANPIVPAGTQLFRLVSGSIYKPSLSAIGVFCEFSGIEGKRGFLGIDKPQIRRCFVDQDNDGSFDGWFASYSCYAPFPAIAGKIADDYGKPEGGRYTSVDPKMIKGGPELALIANGIAPIDGKMKFGVVYGTGEYVPVFGGVSSNTKIPNQKRVFGALFTMLEKRDKAMRIKIDSPIPAQPFAITPGECR
jgi:hypothetical protein